MLVLLIVPLTIITYISYSNSAVLEMAVIQKKDFVSISSKFDETFQEYAAFLHDISDMPETDIEGYDYPDNNDMANYQHLPTSNDPVKTDFYQSFFSDLLQGDTYAMNIYLATEDNQFYLADIPEQASNLNGYKATSTEWYQTAIENSGQVIWTEPYLDTGSGKSTITLAKTVKNIVVKLPESLG